jgi:hypothetical protein
LSHSVDQENGLQRRIRSVFSIAGARELTDRNVRRVQDDLDDDSEVAPFPMTAPPVRRYDEAGRWAIATHFVWRCAPRAFDACGARKSFATGDEDEVMAADLVGRQ